jgi:hypothetical protein
MPPQGWRRLRKWCWSLYVEYDLWHTRVHLLWLWEFWIGVFAWWLCWTCCRIPIVLLRSSISVSLPLYRWVFSIDRWDFFPYQPVNLLLFLSRFVFFFWRCVLSSLTCNRSVVCQLLDPIYTKINFRFQLERKLQYNEILDKYSGGCC